MLKYKDATRGLSQQKQQTDLLCVCAVSLPIGAGYYTLFENRKVKTYYISVLVHMLARR